MPHAANAPEPLPRHASAVVVGSGFSGIGAAVALRRAGIDVVVLERAGSLGGTWRDNTYPGAACDIPSQLYSFSFATRPDWSHAYARQAEIRAYLEQVAAEHDVLPVLHCGTEVVTGRWDEGALLWRLETNRGSLTADVLVSACGHLAEPRLPDVPGVADFAGPSFHSARWDHSVELAGKRIAVVGTGASAAQFLPELQKVAERVIVFQRTPPWVIPRRDRTYTELERRLYQRFPVLLRVARGWQYLSFEWVLRAFTHGGRVRRLFAGRAHRLRKTQVADPELRAQLTPDYEIGCNRVLISNEFYPALTAGNVDLVTAPLAEVRPHSVVDARGVDHEVDVVIYGTGFSLMGNPLAHRLTGRAGRTLREEWDRDGARAHRGTTVAGFPNLFMLLGPNVVLAHTSVIVMIEAQIRYVVAALKFLRSAGARALEVRRSAQDSYNAALREGLAGTVWETGGCRSWYHDEHGRNVALWPWHTSTFIRQMRRFDAESYELLAG